MVAPFYFGALKKAHGFELEISMPCRCRECSVWPGSPHDRRTTNYKGNVCKLTKHSPTPRRPTLLPSKTRAGWSSRRNSPGCFVLLTRSEEHTSELQSPMYLV